MDRAGRDLDALGLQVDVDCVQHHAAQIMLFQQMTEAADGRLIGCRRRAKVNPDKPLQDRRLIQRLLHARVGQVEPLLHEVSPQHDLKPDRTPPVASLRIVRTDQRQQTRPSNHKFHLIQKQLAPALPTILLELHLTRKCPLPHRSSPLTIRLINQAVDAEFVQRLPKELAFTVEDSEVRRVAKELITLTIDAKLNQCFCTLLQYHIES
jgi:hypothetical protein